MRTLAIIFGILLLLPGLCFLGFGVMFSFGGPSSSGFGFSELAIGVVITGVAVALLWPRSK
jgi:hypothetical protein